MAWKVAKGRLPGSVAAGLLALAAAIPAAAAGSRPVLSKAIEDAREVAEAEVPVEQAVRAEAEANREELRGLFEAMDAEVREQFRREAAAPLDGRWRGEMVLEEARGPNCARAYTRNVKLDLTVRGDTIAGEALGRGASRLRFVLKGKLDEAGRWSAQARDLSNDTWYSLALEGALAAGEGTWRDYSNGCTGRFTLTRTE
jgi:hypothetical protein